MSACPRNPDDIVDRFCMLGPADAHIDKLRRLRDLGVDHFGIYLIHDAQQATLKAYGETVIRAVNG